VFASGVSSRRGEGRSIPEQEHVIGGQLWGLDGSAKAAVFWRRAGQHRFTNPRRENACRKVARASPSRVGYRLRVLTAWQGDTVEWTEGNSTRASG